MLLSFTVDGSLRQTAAGVLAAADGITQDGACRIHRTKVSATPSYQFPLMEDVDWSRQRQWTQYQSLMDDRREEVIVRQEEALDGTVEDNNLDVRIRFERRDDFIQGRNGLRPKDV
jgi:hypothetical protein